jgi:hypothetical protein
LEEFQNRIQEFQDKKRKRIDYLKEEKIVKDFQECTFTPNHQNNQSSLSLKHSKSASRLTGSKTSARNM